MVPLNYQMNFQRLKGNAVRAFEERHLIVFLKIFKTVAVPATVNEE